MIKYICPVCGCRTLASRGENDICQVCYWQDDGEYDDYAPSDANGGICIMRARKNFLEFGAADEQFVRSTRKPLRSEITDNYIKLLNTNGGN